MASVKIVRKKVKTIRTPETSFFLHTSKKSKTKQKNKNNRKAENMVVHAG